MPKVDDYRSELRTLSDWEPYLRAHSGLPGPRGNLELARAVMEEGSADLFARLREWNPERGPTNTPEEFLAFCGVYGLGQLASEGDGAAVALLRPFASDPRWRVREAVAMALQRFGEVEPGALLATAQAWATGNLLEQRAAIAALAEPSLLRYKALALGALSLIDDVTDSVSRAPHRRTEDYRVLRQALGYAWSVLVAAEPGTGRPRFERLISKADPDVQWIVRENLKKARLKRLDPDWVAGLLAQLK